MNLEMLPGTHLQARGMLPYRGGAEVCSDTHARASNPGLSATISAFSRTRWEMVEWRGTEYARIPTYPRYAVSRSGDVVLAEATVSRVKPITRKGRQRVRLSRHAGNDLQVATVDPLLLPAVAWRDVDAYRRRKALRQRLITKGDGRMLGAFIRGVAAAGGEVTL